MFQPTNILHFLEAYARPHASVSSPPVCVKWRRRDSKGHSLRPPPSEALSHTNARHPCSSLLSWKWHQMTTRGLLARSSRGRHLRQCTSRCIAVA